MSESIDQFIERVTAYTEKATKGPWQDRPTEGNEIFGQFVSCREEELDECVVKPEILNFSGRVIVGLDVKFDDRNFICNSRTDLPTAIVHIAALQARVGQFHAACLSVKAALEVVNPQLLDGTGGVDAVAKRVEAKHGRAMAMACKELFAALEANGGKG